MKNYVVEKMFSEEDIKSKVQSLAKRITDDYRDRNNPLLLIGLLRGSYIFLADLSRAIDLEHEIDFMSVSSYGSGTESSGDVRILKDLDENIEGKDVLIVEDIIDTGRTLKKITDTLLLRSPKSLTLCTLLDKPSRRETDIDVKYVGYVIPDEFVVGYGIDYAEKCRHLSFIGKVVFEKE